jgi:hypothetical protein
MRKFILGLVLSVIATQAQQPPAATQPSATSGAGAVAEVYFWKAKPGKFEEYTRYIRDFAEPIDRDAQRHGAYISVTTYVNLRTDAPWTHMRVFVLRDRAQQAALGAELDAARLRLHPDEAERARAAAYAETLRELAGHETVEVLH